MKRYVFEVGDGMNPRKDYSGGFEYREVPHDCLMRNMIWQVFRPTPAEEFLIENTDIDRDETSATMVINEGPDGECAPNGGPWLVARVEEV